MKLIRKIKNLNSVIRVGTKFNKENLEFIVVGRQGKNKFVCKDIRNNRFKAFDKKCIKDCIASVSNSKGWSELQTAVDALHARHPNVESNTLDQVLRNFREEDCDDYPYTLDQAL